MQWLYRIIGVKVQTQTQYEELKAGFEDGTKTILPSLLAMMIWAVVTAVAMVAAGMPWYYVLITNVIVYAASAQLAVLTMLMVQAPLPIIWLAASVVNLRFVIFSANLKFYFRHLNVWQRLMYGFLHTDIGSMLFAFRYRNQTPIPATLEQTGFYFGLNAPNWLSWQIGCVIGVLLASALPMTWGLDLAASLTLLVLVIKGVEHWAGVASCVVAALSAVFLQFLPFKLWVFAAIILGVATALLVEFVAPNAFIKPRPQAEEAA
ncbi:MAG: AzlC family ABC transporter permease [Formosimonas sp.]